MYISSQTSDNVPTSVVPKNSTRILRESLDYIEIWLSAQSSESPIAFRSVSQVPLPLSHLQSTFGLSEADVQVLLLCVGSELYPKWGELFLHAQYPPQLAYPAFQIVEKMMPASGLKAISESGPLRRWHMIDRGPGLTRAMSLMTLDERILSYILEIDCIDRCLDNIFSKITERPAQRTLSHQHIIEELSGARRNSVQRFHLFGKSATLQYSIAQDFCDQQNLTLYSLTIDALPTTQEELQKILKLWRREVKLNGYALIVNWPESVDDPQLEGWLRSLIAQSEGTIVVLSSERKTIHGTVCTIQIEAPTLNQQRLLWSQALKNTNDRFACVINALVGQFNLEPAAIRNAAVTIDSHADADTVQSQLWQACRIQARPQLDSICQRIETRETWEDLILPKQQKRVLEMIVAHNQQRTTVYEDWGFSSKSSRGLGTTVLFSGPSGTGKTMAANVVAKTLDLDLYKVDLSTVVSKYIGETEKNLKLIFDAAESGGVILLFDEADAIFGKRSEVKDARDRYANMEVSYLLQRMESYRGLAILTTNMPGAIDEAFIRRIRFITRFPIPEYEERKKIWQKVFPSGVPITESVDNRKLARLSVSGGTIRSIALSAAFLAASEAAAEKCNKPGITMEHIYYATEAEYSKIRQPMPDEMTKGWID